MAAIFKSFQVVSRFVAISFVLTLVLLIAFLLQVGKPDNLIAFFYMLSIPFYYYFLIWLLSILIAPLSRLALLKYLVIIPKVVLDIFLLADIFVFKIYRFHIDMLFINMTIHDFGGIGLSTSIILMAIVSFLLIIFFNLWVFHIAVKMNKFHTKKLTFVLLVFFLFGQLMHVWANEYKQQSITKFTPYFPHYLPLTSSSMMSKLKNSYPEIIPSPIESVNNGLEEVFANNHSDASIFNYPNNPLVFNDSIKQRPNILFFLTESWRADMLTAEITPNISAFSKSSFEFSNHYSTGSVTVSGLFGLMYGLHPSYLKYAQSDPFKYQTLLTKSLSQLGYEISAYTPSNLDRFSLKPMLFGQITSGNFINQRSLATIDNDREVVDELIDDIGKSDSNKPWFKFVFLDSSHHNYNYPDENKKFLPIPKNSEAFVFNKSIDAEPFLNDYKNSLNYIDALFGEIYQAINEAGLDENTVVVVTSDHAEEFNDNGLGYWGHGSNFTSFQTAVPLIIKFNEKNQHQLVSKLSGHVDIVPTIMSQVLNCTNPISDYSSGYDLTDLPDQRGIAISSYTDKAFIIGDKVYANGLSFESYHVDDITAKNDTIDYQKITKIRKEETTFLNKN